VSVGAERDVVEDPPESKEDSAEAPEKASSSESSDQSKPVRLVKTSCGDAHNLGLDADGRAYSLPSPLDVDVFPGSAKPHRVTDVVCGKEHCLLLTEHGQVSCLQKCQCIL
jgi:alpha-tubulin suppressor-like RCC1 family protein